MTSFKWRGMRRGLLALASGTIMTSLPAFAQQRANLPPGAVVQPLGPDGGADLRRALTQVGTNAESSSALITAGREALAMGDGQAALTFFTRADALSPRDARAKAGIGAALAHIGQPATALSLFQEAVSLGAPEAEIAGDRGLAYDLVGDPARAQQDYALSLRNREDPEIQRRLALSLAVSGQREAALRILHEQLRGNDRAAWRTQAFVLALTGDAAGASRTAQSVMPGTAQAMSPFFARLSGLSPAQKAMAVHLGHFPSDGRVAMAGNVDTSADPGALALAQGGVPAAVVQPQSRPADTTASRRRPDPISSAARADLGRLERGTRTTAPPPRQRSQNNPAPAPQAQRETVQLAQRDPVQLAQRDPTPAPLPQRFSPSPAPGTATPTAAPVQRFQPASTAPTSVPRPDPAPGFSIAQAGPSPTPPPPASPTRQPAPTPVTPPRFADIAAVVNALPQEEVSRPAAPAPRPAPTPTRQAQAPARTAQTSPAPQPRQQARRPAPPAHPSRHWVQIAGGANRDTLPREYARLRGEAPALLGNRPAYTTPLNATNRLLIGPFPSAREAQAFVNRLAQEDLSAFAWTSPAGQEIERLPTGR